MPCEALAKQGGSREGFSPRMARMNADVAFEGCNPERETRNPELGFVGRCRAGSPNPAVLLRLALPVILSAAKDPFAYRRPNRTRMDASLRSA